MTSRILTASETDTLHGWIAEGLRYPELAKRMLAQFGADKVVSPPDCTYHRKRYATKIADLRDRLAKQAERRKRDRQAKAARRNGGGHAA